MEKDAKTGFHDALSPDGATLALARDGEREIHVRLLSLVGGADREITVAGWPNAASLEWSSDGKGLYCGSMTSQIGTLLYIALKDIALTRSARVVLRSSEVGGGTFIAAVPSPDGRHLALTGAIHQSSAWLMEQF